MENIIEVSGLTKKYGSLTAVDDISFTVEEGQLFAFLGPNGAGKSTTINVICTLLSKTAGEVTVDGHIVGREDNAVRHSIGIVFQDNVLDDLLTVKENLLTRGALYGTEGNALKNRLKKVGGIMGVTELFDRPFGKLSGGQKRRCEIARALMSDPKILFLDEPTTGLDPQTRLNVWNTVRALQKEHNMTVFLTTHYMEEAADADMVAIIDGGKIAAKGTPNELKESYSTDTLRLAPSDMAAAEEFCKSRKLRYEPVADMLYISVEDSLHGYRLLKELEDGFTAFEMVRGNMDDVFVGITGHRIREDG